MWHVVVIWSHYPNAEANKETKKYTEAEARWKKTNKETKKQRNQQPPLHLYHTKALPRSYRHLFQLFFQDSVTASDVVHSELQEDLSGNFSEFGRWFLHKILLRQYILGWKIVGSFIVNSVAHEKCKQAQKKYKNVGNTRTYCFSNERANLNLQFARHFSLWTEDGVSSVDDKMNARAWR